MFSLSDAVRSSVRRLAAIGILAGLLISSSHALDLAPRGKMTLSGPTPSPLSFVDVYAFPNSFFLGSLAPGQYHLTISGVAAGSGFDTYSGLLRAGAVVAPIPEPEIWAMLLVALGLVAMRLRRKSRIDGGRRFAYHPKSIQVETLCFSRAGGFGQSGLDLSFDNDELSVPAAGPVAELATSRSLLGVSILPFRRPDAVAYVESMLAAGTPTRLAFANSNLLNMAYADRGLRTLLKHFLVLNDGVGVNLASKLMYGAPFPDNLNGTDFCPEFLETCRLPLRLYLLGARPSVVSRATEVFASRWPRHQVVGAQDGYFAESEFASIKEQIAAARPDLVFVAMGNGLQERIIDELVPSCVRCAWGVGAWFDFLAGEVPRAPRFLQKAGGEWMFRLAQEPRRLWKRYVVGNPVFLWRVIMQRIRPTGRGPAALPE